MAAHSNHFIAWQVPAARSARAACGCLDGYNLAGHLKVQGDSRGAMKLYNEAVRTGREVLGEKHPHVDMFQTELKRLELEMELQS